MVEESPRASLGSCASLGGVGRGFIVSFPNPLWEGPLGLSCEDLNHRTGDTPVTFHVQHSLIQTACFPGVGLRSLTPKLDWQPELSAIIRSHRMAVMGRQGRVCALQTCKSPSHALSLPHWLCQRFLQENR